MAEPVGPHTVKPDPDPIDPTKNVLDLVKQSVRRLDDLRAMEATHTREIIKMNREHDNDLRVAEAKRIDAIRSVDQGTTAATAQVQAIAATTLAGQVASTKDAAQAATAAAALASGVALKAETDPLRKDIGDLRQSQWTIAGGRQQGQTERAEADTITKNKGMWIGIAVAVFASMASATLTVISIAVVIYVNSR